MNGTPKSTDSTTFITYARDRSTSITGLIKDPIPYSYITPPTHLITNTPCESVSGRIIKSSPKQPTTEVSESPKPHPQIERTSTDGSNKQSNNGTSVELQAIGQNRLECSNKGCQEYELDGQICQSNHHFHPSKLVLDKNRNIPTRFPRSVWNHRFVSTTNFYLAYCTTCKQFVYVSI